MRVNYSYIEEFFKILSGQAAIKDIQHNTAFKIISAHANKFENDFSLHKLEKVINKKSEEIFGFKDFFKNRGAILNLINLMKKKEGKWLKEVQESIRCLFPKTEFKDITIYPVIGYDIGIGINKAVCINVNTEIFLNNFKELISTTIHETAHVMYEKYHGPIRGLNEIGSFYSMKEFLDYYIHYEGTGVFAAEEFRIKNRLPNSGTPIQEDYLLSSNKDMIFKLLNEYRSLVDDLKHNKVHSIYEFLERGFGRSRLTHRLGFAIFDAINRKYGIEEIQKAIALPSEKFMKKYLSILELERA
ncbi:hypothetical protein BBF96_12140 [Anoxybacter fermentans]|uniref:DUF2268 domain-containing protein n=1 Tax=Anoxybacter fermentans TaxID=1323375 RepID=A0A3Q9HRG2_9FIRM|nr:DUF5700 domain-containing putative Zn-dependent protease [Anoxybacter fermentans]AZR74080.1 hypothetical protein BBF96_12140 [Anoxybacter fermentans]